MHWHRNGIFTTHQILNFLFSHSPYINKNIFAVYFTAIRPVAREKSMFIAITVNNLTRVAAIKKFTDLLSNNG
jgi:hypothetical protein